MSDERLEQALAEVESLKSRIERLERQDQTTAHFPDSWLFSDSFLTRAFAVLGHYFVASLIIAIPFYLLIIMASIFISTGPFRF